MPRQGNLRHNYRQASRDRVRPDLGDRKAVTVCISALFRWPYPEEEGYAALAVSDRMITLGDVQYEPTHAHITPAILLMIAGDYSLHSQAIRRTIAHFKEDQKATPELVSSFYGRAIQAIKLKEAEDLYLAPLGLNSDSFLAQQKDMAPHFVSLLTDQMQGYKGDDAEALIVGYNPGGVINIYGVDSKGMVACYDDVGFAAIGIGSWHARSRLMQATYTSHASGYAAALGLVYAAKRIAELAPGVGKYTDIKIVFRNSIETIAPDTFGQLVSLYDEFAPKAHQLGLEYIGKLHSAIFKVSEQKGLENAEKSDGANTTHFCQVYNCQYQEGSHARRCLKAAGETTPLFF